MITIKIKFYLSKWFSSLDFKNKKNINEINQEENLNFVKYINKFEKITYEKNGNNLIKNVFWVNKNYWFIILFLAIINSIIKILIPKIIIIFINNITEQTSYLIIITTIFIVLKVIDIFLFNHIFYNLGYFSIKIKCVINYLIFSKLFKIKNLNNNLYSFGDIINLNNIQSWKFVKLFVNIPKIITSPIIVVISIYYLYDLVGISAIISLTVFIFWTILVFILSKSLILYEKDIIEVKGKRLKLLNEILTGIKLIKFNVLEDYFIKKLLNLKNKELDKLNKYNNKNIVLLILSWIIPLTFIFILIICEYLIYGKLNIIKILQAIIIFNLLDENVKLMPQILALCIDSYISGKQINDFLIQKELDLKKINYVKESKNFLNIKNGNFSWYKENKNKDQFILSNINIKIKNKSLNGIIGKIGSGKTSLINSLFGELEINNIEKFKVLNSISIVSQKPWIRNKTLKKNILNGKIFNEKLYKDCIYYSCLTDDINSLDNGDDTIIGEKGINLSGGQKTRVSIARAIYSNKDAYIFDDSFSSLDINVSSFIFENLILNYLKNKTRIIITHNEEYFKYLDNLIYLDNGKIIFNGNYDQFKDNFEFNKLLKNENLSKIYNNENKKNNIKIVNTSDNDPVLNKILDANNKNICKLDMNKIWFQYINYSKNIYKFILVVIIVTLIGLLFYYSFYFINYSKNWDTNKFIFYYFLISIAQVCLVYFRWKLLFKISNENSFNIHKNMIYKLIHSSLTKFLDKIPHGVLFNIFSKDLEEVDKNIITYISILLFLIQRNCISIILLVMNSSYFILLIFAIYLFICYKYKNSYMIFFSKVIKNMKNSELPINQVLNESLIGSFIIRVYNNNKIIKNEYINFLKTNYYYEILFNKLKFWFSWRIELLNITLVIPLFVFLINLKNNNINLAIMFNFLLMFLDLSSLFFLFSCIFEENLISFERCKYITEIKIEKNYKCSYQENNIKNGKIELKNLKIKYSSNSSYIIKGISWVLENKIGIIGKTGSGKTTLVHSLLGIFEDYEGSIKIDNIELKDINLKNLRKNFSIITQDPILFNDTIKNNIDPLGNNSDAEILNLLNEIDIIDKINSLGGLYGKIDYQGKNLSQGEKQLLCLIRVILNKSKIILFDEATSNIDTNTEKLIQFLMNKYLSTVTQIIIAHRIDTVLNCNKILVLENGLVKAFDSPKNLKLDN